MEETSKHGVLGRHQTCLKKNGFKFNQTRSNAIILHETLPAYCIPKVVRMETGEVIYEKVYESPQPPPKISLRNDWMKELGSEVARQAEDNQPTQPNPIQFTEQGDLLRQNKRPVRVLRKSTHVSHLAARVDKDKDTDENVHADRVRTGRPVGCEQSIDLFTQREEIDIDFRVSGLPHAVVKQAENFRVRELVKKIESHPHREAVQADLQQSDAYNPFSEKSKKMIRDMGAM